MATYSSATQRYYTLQLTVTESEVDKTNNRSKLSYSLVLKTGSTYFSDIKIGYTIKIDGTTVASLNYSSASYSSMDRNSSKTLYSSTCYVNHGSDGTKSIAAGQISASLNTATGQIVPNLSLSNSSALVLTAIPRESTITTAADSTLMGTVRHIYVNRQNNSYAHTLTYTFGNATGSITSGKTTSETIDWTVPKSLAAQIEAGAIRASGTITCTTYASTSSSTVIGTPTTVSFVAQIPATEPSLSSASVTMGNNVTVSLSGRAASNLTHKLTYSFNSGAKTGTIVSSTSATSYTWAIPKSLAAYVTSGSVSSSCVVTCTTYNGTASVGSKTATITTVTIPKSTFTLSASSLTIGSGSLTINISRAASNLTHTISYSPDNSTYYTIVTRTDQTSYTWTPAYSVAARFTGSSATWYIRVATYNYQDSSHTGSVGNNVTTFVIKVSSSDTNVQPSGSVSTSSSTTTPSAFSGLFIQGNSTLTVSYSAAAANNGNSSPTYYASLASYSLKVAGSVVASGSLSSSTLSGSYTTPSALSSTGSVSVSLTVVDSHGFSKTVSKSITVQAYTSPSLGPKEGNNKIIVARCDQNGNLDPSGTYLHIECSRTISQIKNGSNTQINTGYIHYKIDDGSWTQIGSGSTNASADGTVAHASANLDVTQNYTIQLRAYDTFGGTSGARIMSFSIPTDKVDYDLRDGGSGLALGMYSQGSNHLDVGWNGYFYNQLSADRILSLREAESGGYSIIRVVPRWNYTDILSGNNDLLPATNYLEAWVKKVVQMYSTSTSTAFIGNAVPSGQGMIAAYIYNCADVSGGLPNYCTGIYIPVASLTSEYRGAIIRFGTYNYTFWYNVIGGRESVGITFTTNNGIISSSGNLGMTAYASGRVVVLSCAPTFTNQAGGGNYVKVATIDDSRYHPHFDVYQSVPAQTSQNTNYMATFHVNTSGEIKIYKNTTSTGTYRANLSWIA